MYEENDDVWAGLVRLVVGDFKEAQATGIDLGQDGLLFPIVLGNKGDWSYLAFCQHVGMFNFVLVFTA